MEYKFEKIEEDLYKLTLGEKEYQIKRDLDCIVDLQQIDLEARIILNQKLKEKGVDTGVLITSRKEGNKEIIDDSEYQKALKDCQNLARINKLDTILFKKIGIKLTELALMINDPKQYQNFIADFIKILAGEGEAKKGNITP
jgi:hypothetical protein